MQNNKTLTAKIVTNTREELIALSAFLARAITPQIKAQNTAQIISINAGESEGKSLIIEAMMRSLIDGQDYRDMIKEGETNKMFLEKRPEEATDKYLSKKCKVEGYRATLAFDRITHAYMINRATLLKNAFNNNAPPFHKRGLIFETDSARFVRNDRTDVSDITNDSLITINLGLNNKGTEPLHKSVSTAWGRDIKIRVNTKLLEDQSHFMKHWQQIENYQDNKTLIEPDNAKPPSFTPSLKNHVFGRKQTPINYTSP
jgi:hypothetical protein